MGNTGAAPGAVGGRAETPPGEEREPAGASRARPQRWGDPSWWQEEITAATSAPDPILSNVKITLAHQELSLAMHEVTGTGSGANFHTWAVWGSKKAGKTIRHEDVPRLPAIAGAVGAVSAVRAVRAVARGRPAALSILAAASGAAASRAAVRHALDRTAAQIFAGNVTVVDDIGRQSARFVCEFLEPRHRTDARLERFLEELRDGPTQDGGQQLLQEAYTQYFEASRTPAGDRRDELMLCANLLAILHEHHRLDPYIDAAIPGPLRTIVTRYLLDFTVGTEALRVSGDIPWRGRTEFPETLRSIESPALTTLLRGQDGLDRTPDSTVGSGARDWSELSDRMNFIVDLFRTRQFDQNLFAPPFSPGERAELTRRHPHIPCSW